MFQRSSPHRANRTNKLKLAAPRASIPIPSFLRNPMLVRAMCGRATAPPARSVRPSVFIDIGIAAMRFYGCGSELGGARGRTGPAPSRDTCVRVRAGRRRAGPTASGAATRVNRGKYVSHFYHPAAAVCTYLGRCVRGTANRRFDVVWPAPSPPYLRPHPHPRAAYIQPCPLAAPLRMPRARGQGRRGTHPLRAAAAPRALRDGACGRVCLCVRTRSRCAHVQHTKRTRTRVKGTGVRTYGLRMTRRRVVGRTD